MNIELNNLLEDLFLSLDEYLDEYKDLANEIKEDNNLMNLINKYNEIVKYNKDSEELVTLKNKLFSDNRYSKYLKYENELLYLSFEMSDKLKSIIKGDSIEGN